MIRIVITQRTQKQVDVSFYTEEGQPVPVGLLLGLLDAAEESLLSAGIPTRPIPYPQPAADQQPVPSSAQEPKQ